MSALKTIIGGLILFSCAEVFPQTQNARAAFEAVSIKPAAPMPAAFMPGTRLVCPLSGCGGPGTSDPGLMRFTNISLRHLIEAAYNVMPYRVDAPSWLDSSQFDVAATVPQGATREQATLMLQNLLADRFQLKLHHSTKDLSVYILVVAKNGPKLKESASSGSPPPPTAAGRGKARGTIWTTDASGARLIKLEFDAQTIAKFSDALTLQADRPVIDMTGLMGKYDIRLEFAPDISNPHTAPDLFTALTEQLGLKLESRKAPVDVLILDSAAKLPTEN